MYINLLAIVLSLYIPAVYLCCKKLENWQHDRSLLDQDLCCPASIFLGCPQPPVYLGYNIISDNNGYRILYVDIRTGEKLSLIRLLLVSSFIQ